MDKYEYRVKLEQIEKLVSKKDFITAAKIADGIDWRRVKSVNTLNMIADIYEETNRLEDCMEILEMVYDRSPIGRAAIYRMAETSVKMGDFEKAKELYRAFVKIAPNNLNRYLLKYSICRAQGDSLEEQIGILEEYKSHEYHEHWAYELACLYEEAGRIEQCVEECDELILWFSEGEYVIKAMELKKRYQELTAYQQEKYERRFENLSDEDGEAEFEETEGAAAEDVSAAVETGEGIEAGAVIEAAVAEASVEAEMKVKEESEEKPEEDDTPVVSEINVNKFSTINLQQELAEGLRQLFEQEEAAAAEAAVSEEAVAVEITQEFLPVKEPVWELKKEADVEEETKSEPESAAEPENVMVSEPEPVQMSESEPNVEPEPSAEPEPSTEPEPSAEPEIEPEKEEKSLSDTGEIYTELLKYAAVEKEETTEQYYSMEEDGQLRLVMEHEHTPDKQITGQMSIGEILEAWEEKKRQAKEKIAEMKKNAVLCETGEITGILEDFMPRAPREAADENEPVAELFVEEAVEETLEEPAEEAAEEIVEEQVEEAVEETITESEEEFTEAFPEEETLEDDLPPEIEPEEESEEEPEIEEPQVEEKKETPIGQNTASMLDAIERALAQEIEPFETAGTYLTEEQEKILAYFTSVKGMKKQLLAILEEEKAVEQREDSVTGNLVIKGHPGNGKTTLAINIVKVLQKQRGVKGGKIAKVTGNGMNKKSPEEVIEKIGAGALIIESAGDMNDDAIEKLSRVMEGYTGGVLVILEDSGEAIEAIFEKHEEFAEKFNRTINIPIFSNDELVAFGKSYAEEQEFYFDEMAVLALYDCIGVRQTAEHVVNVAEVKELVDRAIAYAQKRGRGFFARLSRKRVDEDGNRLILEEDFDFK